MTLAATFHAARALIAKEPRHCVVTAIATETMRGAPLAIQAFADAARIDWKWTPTASLEPVYMWWDAATQMQRDAAFDRAIALAEKDEASC